MRVARSVGLCADRAGRVSLDSSRKHSKTGNIQTSEWAMWWIDSAALDRTSMWGAQKSRALYGIRSILISPTARILNRTLPSAHVNSTIYSSWMGTMLQGYSVRSYLKTLRNVEEPLHNQTIISISRARYRRQSF